MIKCDMAGAAAVLGSSLVDLEPIIELRHLCAKHASGSAYRPETSSARAVARHRDLKHRRRGSRHIGGRSGAASDLKPDMMIDLATLTGACMIALGEEITGLMTDTIH